MSDTRNCMGSSGNSAEPGDPGRKDLSVRNVVAEVQTKKRRLAPQDDNNTLAAAIASIFHPIVNMNMPAGANANALRASMKEAVHAVQAGAVNVTEAVLRWLALDRWMTDGSETEARLYGIFLPKMPRNGRAPMVLNAYPARIEGGVVTFSDGDTVSIDEFKEGDYLSSYAGYLYVPDSADNAKLVERCLAAKVIESEMRLPMWRGHVYRMHAGVLRDEGGQQDINLKPV